MGINEEITKKILEYFQNIEDFAKTELPSFLKEIILYETISHFVLIIALAVFSYILFRYIKRRRDMGEEYFDDMLIVPAVCLLGSVPLLLHYLLRLIMIYLSPKYFLLNLFLDR